MYMEVFSKSVYFGFRIKERKNIEQYLLEYKAYFFYIIE